jgi:preprotein translocase subunit SecE
MAKSKAVTSKKNSSPPSKDNRSNNFLVEQYYAVRSEVKKVTWPTRDEARQLTIAVTGITIAISLFLAGVDAIFFEVVTGIVSLNIVWIVAVFVLLALIALAFYTNGREV